MSSRVLRKLHGKEDLETKLCTEDNSDPDNGGPADLIGSTKKKTNFNCFYLLNEAGDSSENNEDSPEEVSEENHETEASVMKRHENPVTHNKKKKKKRKKPKKAQTNACSSEDNINNDDIERLVKEVDEIMGEISSVPIKQKHSTGTTNHGSLLSIEVRNLNPNNELKKIFGSRTVQADLRPRRGRGSRTLRSFLLISPKDNWPQYSKQGLAMQLLNSDSKSSTFTFVHNQAYQAVEKKYLQAVASSVPDNIVALVNSHPFHVNGNLSLSDFCRLSEDLAMAAELVERALYAFEHAFHPSFNIASGTCRLPYQRQVNRSFHVALLKHALYVGGRACYRTALEIWKLLLSLDPEDDPLAVVLAIDFYAIRSSQYEWFIQFCEELESRRNLLQLPNMAYSLAIAKFLLAKKLRNKQGSTEARVDTLTEEADKHLQEALIMFPAALPLILEKCSINAPQHSFFTLDAQKSQSPALEQLVKLYVCRSYHVWKEPELIPWLERNTNEVVVRIDRKDPAIEDASQKRARRYRGPLPRNILRHIILCDLQQVTPNALPPNDRAGPIMSLDPLPPSDSVDQYSWPRYQRPTSSVDYAVRIIQSLLPSFDVNELIGNGENAAENVAEQAEGEGNNENNLFGVANNLHQRIRSLFLMANGNDRDDLLDDSDISDYDDDDDDDDDDAW